MKYLLITLLVSVPCVAQSPHCQPALYDALYLRLVKERLEFTINKLVVINRDGLVYNNSDLPPEPDVFKIFRQLCYGQKTSWEKTKVIPKDAE